MIQSVLDTWEEDFDFNADTSNGSFDEQTAMADVPTSSSVGDPPIFAFSAIPRSREHLSVPDLLKSKVSHCLTEKISIQTDGEIRRKAKSILPTQLPRPPIVKQGDYVLRQQVGQELDLTHVDRGSTKISENEGSSLSPSPSMLLDLKDDADFEQKELTAVVGDAELKIDPNEIKSCNHINYSTHFSRNDEKPEGEELEKLAAFDSLGISVDEESVFAEPLLSSKPESYLVEAAAPLPTNMEGSDPAKMASPDVRPHCSGLAPVNQPFMENSENERSCLISTSFSSTKSAELDLDMLVKPLTFFYYCKDASIFSGRCLPKIISRYGCDPSNPYKILSLTIYEPGSISIGPKNSAEPNLCLSFFNWLGISYLLDSDDTIEEALYYLLFSNRPCKDSLWEAYKSTYISIVNVFLTACPENNDASPLFWCFLSALMKTEDISSAVNFLLAYISKLLPSPNDLEDSLLCKINGMLVAGDSDGAVRFCLSEASHLAMIFGMTPTPQVSSQALNPGLFEYVPKTVKDYERDTGDIKFSRLLIFRAYLILGDLDHAVTYLRGLDSSNVFLEQNWLMILVHALRTRSPVDFPRFYAQLGELFLQSTCRSYLSQLLFLLSEGKSMTEYCLFSDIFQSRRKFSRKHWRREWIIAFLSSRFTELILLHVYKGQEPSSVAFGDEKYLFASWFWEHSDSIKPLLTSCSQHSKPKCLKWMIPGLSLNLQLDNLRPSNQLSNDSLLTSLEETPSASPIQSAVNNDQNPPSLPAYTNESDVAPEIQQLESEVKDPNSLITNYENKPVDSSSSLISQHSDASQSSLMKKLVGIFRSTPTDDSGKVVYRANLGGENVLEFDKDLKRYVPKHMSAEARKEYVKSALPQPPPKVAVTSSKGKKERQRAVKPVPAPQAATYIPTAIPQSVNIDDIPLPEFNNDTLSLPNLQGRSTGVEQPIEAVTEIQMGRNDDISARDIPNVGDVGVQPYSVESTILATSPHFEAAADVKASLEHAAYQKTVDPYLDGAFSATDLPRASLGRRNVKDKYPDPFGLSATRP